MSCACPIHSDRRGCYERRAGYDMLLIMDPDKYERVTSEDDYECECGCHDAFDYDSDDDWEQEAA